MAHKNDYTVIVFFPGVKPKKYTYVHNLGGFASFLNNKHSSWLYINIYDRRKANYLARYYKGSFVPAFI